MTKKAHYFTYILSCSITSLLFVLLSSHMITFFSSVPPHTTTISLSNFEIFNSCTICCPQQKTPSTTMVEGWKRVTTALDNFDEGKSVQKLSSAEDVDSAIDKMESQFESLEVRFKHSRLKSIHHFV